MAKKKSTGKKKNGLKAGLIAASAALLLYAVIFHLHEPLDYVIGGGLAALTGWVVKTMATPMQGLDKNAKSKAALNATVIEDDYARGMVEKGVEMLDAFKAERDAINEYVFTRRINELRAGLDKVLRHIIEDPDKAHRLRKLNSYYMPTAVKLLQSYRSAKQQGTSYMAISSTREDVLSTLDQLNEALTTVLDAMIKDDLEDMDIEIDVFEQMLKADGLREDELTQEMRQSAHAAAREIPMSQAPTVQPTVPVKAANAQRTPVQMPVQKPVAKPVQQPAVKPAATPVQKPAEKPAPVKAEAPAKPDYRPEGVTLDYTVQVEDGKDTPVPYLNVPAASTASARQFMEGTPVLHVPDMPAAPDFADAIAQENKA